MDEVDSAAARRGRRSGSDELRRVGELESRRGMKRKIIRFHKNKRKECSYVSNLSYYPVASEQLALLFHSREQHQIIDFRSCTWRMQALSTAFMAWYWYLLSSSYVQIGLIIITL